jgi:hypothetical protein
MPEVRQRSLLMIKVSDSQDRLGIAILIPKNYLCNPLFGYLPSITFKGYRLAGGRFMGAASKKLHRALLRGIDRILHRCSGSYLLAEDIEVNGSLWSRFATRREHRLNMFQLTGQEQKHRIRLTGNPEEYWSMFSRKARKEFRRILNKMAKAEVTRFTEVEQVPAFLSDAHQVSLNSWQAKVLGLRVRNDATEHRQLCFLATHGYLRSYVLYQEGRPIAFEIGYQFRNYMHGVEAAYDQEFAKLSPGKVLMYREIEDLMAVNRPDWYDFGEGDAPFKARFSNRTMDSANVWLVPSGLHSSFMLSIVWLNRKIEAAIHWILNVTGLKTRVRQIYRQIGSMQTKS